MGLLDGYCLWELFRRAIEDVSKECVAMVTVCGIRIA